MLGAIGQLSDRLFIKVVIVVVREDHRSQRWQFFQLQRRRVKTLRTGPLHRRGALSKYRVGNKEAIMQFQQYRGMPQTPQAAIRCLKQLLAPQRLDSDVHIRPGSCWLTEKQKLEADAQLFQRAVLR
ncbi:hypothetical protein D3C77_91160 [compost metagenome]